MPGPFDDLVGRLARGVFGDPSKDPTAPAPRTLPDTGGRLAPFNPPSRGGGPTGPGAVNFGTDPTIVRVLPGNVAGADASTSQLITALVTTLGITPEEAEDLVFQEGVLGALKILRGGTSLTGKSAGSGGSTRFLFPEEREALRLSNALLQRDLDTNPNLEPVLNNLTGETFLLDTQTGVSTLAGKFNYPAIDPERQLLIDQGYLDVQRGNLDVARGNLDVNKQRLSMDNIFNTASENRARGELGLNREIAQGQLDISSAGEDRLRRGLEQEAQQSNQAVDVERFNQLRGILANPADFLARAFLSRGKDFPGQITQADLLNALRTEIRDVKAPRFDLATPSPRLGPIDYTQFSSTQPSLTPVVPTPAPAPTIPSVEELNARLFAQGGQAAAAPLTTAFGGNQTKPVKKLEKGGTGLKNRFSLVGERGPELLIHNKDGTFDVIPNDMLADDVVKRADKVGVSRFQFGTISQDDLVDMSKRFAPPAVNALLDNKPIDPLRFDFPLPTPQQTGKLTDDEQTALNTALATRFNSSLSDVVSAQRQRFLGSGGRSARLAV